MNVIAFHLPQYHPIPENDEWWGKGFTEWTNVVKARPLFRGHYQPHLPSDLGFYDLRLPEARAAQAELAREYGIGGFCYYHYWFNGRRVLERPVAEIVASGSPEFPFCVCWANENWTRRWDGREQEILLEQKYGYEDNINHIRSLIPTFSDPRYILVDGKPLFLVYRSTVLPDARATTDCWRKEIERAGLPGLYLVRVESVDDGMDPRDQGFDAALEFAPFGKTTESARISRFEWWQRRRLGTLPDVFKNHRVLSYKKLVDSMLALENPGYPWIRSACPSWDNTSRRKSDGTIVVESTPELFEAWMTGLVRMAKETETETGAESIVFVNAWNEWAEGNHLEPCQKWGRSYLEALRRSLTAGRPV